MAEPTTDWRKFLADSLAEGSAREVRVNAVDLDASSRGVNPAVRNHLLPDAPPEGCDEADFQWRVRAVYLAHGFKFYHTHRSKRSDKDFPDCVGIRAGAQGVVAELKVKKNKPTKGQLEWLELFRSMGFRTFVWYPRDWNQILEVLK